MEKLEKNNVFIPMPMSIIGTKVNGKENFMAAGWITRVNAEPPMIGIAIGKNHHTASGIDETEEFSVIFPSSNDLTKTDYIGIVSGENVDKSELYQTFYGKLKNAPMVKDAPLNLECKVLQKIELPTNNFYIAEIQEAWCDSKYIKSGHLDFKKMDVFFLTMPDNKYWRLGEHIGDAWKDGVTLKK